MLSSCEKYSSATVDRVLYKVHKDVNKVTKKHRDALRLFSFAKFYLKRELKQIQSKWEKAGFEIQRAIFQFFKDFFSLLYLYNHVSIFENIFIFEPCEKENNVAERFGAKENREKMWQNFAASCQDLTDFQMIQERIKIIHCNLFFVNPNLNMHRKHADFRLLRN